MRPPSQFVLVAGRQVAVEDAGPASGFPVIVHHGGTRHLFPGAVRDARAYGLRLISYDRPGQGMSTPQPGRVVADCAQDVQEILAQLGVSRAAAWGSSVGGPYALATAALLPEAITSVCVFASLAPYGAPGLDFADGMSEGFREEIRVLSGDPGRARAEFQARSAEFARLSSSPTWWMDRWADRAGRDAAHSQEWADYLALVNRDGYAGGDEGWWERLERIIPTLGFRPGLHPGAGRLVARAARHRSPAGPFPLARGPHPVRHRTFPRRPRPHQHRGE